MKRFLVVAGSVFLFVGMMFFGLFVSIDEVDAIPAFARHFKTSCQTCHVAFPKLNTFGEAFMTNGYRWPEGVTVEEAEKISLGSNAWKRLWPKAIWPSDIDEVPPIAGLVEGSVNYDPDNENVPVDFATPDNVALLAAGTLGDSFSFYGRFNLFAPGASPHVHRLFGQFKVFDLPLNVKFGQFETRANPFSLNRSMFLDSYLFGTSSFVLGNLPGEHEDEGEGPHDDTLGMMPAMDMGDDHEDDSSDGLHQHGGDFTLGQPQQGLELWGSLDGFGGRGGLEYAFGIVNGNGAGALQDSGTFDNNAGKDLYARAAYTLGGMSLSGRGADPSGRETSLRVGSFWYRGTSPFHDAFDMNETFRRYGGDLRFRVSGFEVFGGALWGNNWALFAQEHHDDDDDHGMSGAMFVMSMGEEDEHHEEAPELITQRVMYRSQMIGATYVTPWQGLFIPSVRYEWIDMPEGLTDVGRFTFNNTFLLRANVKLVPEYYQFLRGPGDKGFKVRLSFAF